MSILFNSTKLSGLQRRLITLIVFMLILTSTQVQSANAMELLPDVQLGTQIVETNDTTDKTALVVPVTDIQEKNTVTKDIKTDKTVVKKKWSKATSADLVTKPEYSSESAVRTMVVPTTAYTSDPRECDSTPFVTANGSQVRDGIVAANFLKFGTRLRIPEYFGDKVFEVHDRMNARYNVRVDIWMLNKADARNWGKRNVTIEILN